MALIDRDDGSHYGRPPQQPTKKARTRKSDPQTSRDAAASVRVTQNQFDVLMLFDVREKMTHTELIEVAKAYGVKQSESGIWSRCADLVESGMVRDSGETKKLETGRQSIVWEATESGRRYLRLGDHPSVE